MGKPKYDPGSLLDISKSETNCKIFNSTFNPEIKTVSWTMPFDWNLSRINHQNILVHEEVKLPRSLFNAFPFDIGW